MIATTHSWKHKSLLLLEYTRNESHCCFKDKESNHSTVAHIVPIYRSSLLAKFESCVLIASQSFHSVAATVDQMIQRPFAQFEYSIVFPTLTAINIFLGTCMDVSHGPEPADTWLCWIANMIFEVRRTLLGS